MRIKRTVITHNSSESNHRYKQEISAERRIKMGLFSKRDPGAMIKKDGGYYCPFCGADLGSVILEEAKPVYQVFARMGAVAGMVTIDTVIDQFVYKQGITCTCGRHVKPINQ